MAGWRSDLIPLRRIRRSALGPLSRLLHRGGGYTGFVVTRGWRLHRGGGYTEVAVTSGWRLYRGGGYIEVTIKSLWRLYRDDGYTEVAVTPGWRLHHGSQPYSARLIAVFRGRAALARRGGYTGVAVTPGSTRFDSLWQQAQRVLLGPSRAGPPLRLHRGVAVTPGLRLLHGSYSILLILSYLAAGSTLPSGAAPRWSAASCASTKPTGARGLSCRLGSG